MKSSPPATLNSGCFSTGAGTGAKVAIVLDAARTPAPERNRVIGLIDEVLSRLPAIYDREIYFLGNPQPYLARRFNHEAQKWFEMNSSRVSLVTPVLETICRGSPLVVIVGAGHVFDLADWLNQPVARQMILATVAEPLGDVGTTLSVLKQPTADRLLEQIHDPVQAVEISGPDFMPFFWDNLAYKVEADSHAHGFRLNVQKAEHYDVCFECLYTGKSAPAVRSTHASGRETVPALEVMAPASIERPPIHRMSKEEEVVFRRAVDKKSFRCLHCQHDHCWHEVRCLSGGSILGKLVYPSMERERLSGFVLCALKQEGAEYQLHPVQVLRLSQDEVAIRQKQKAVIYRFVAGRGWVSTAEAFEPYSSLGGGAYALLV